MAIPQTTLESAQPLACRSVILNGYLLLYVWFGTIGRELSGELGPVDAGDESYFKTIRQHFAKLEAVYKGKSMMHDALQGKLEDTNLLRNLKSHIATLKLALIDPLDNLPADQEAAVNQIKAMGISTKAICIQARNDLHMADGRFAEALSVLAGPTTDKYSIISVDMVGYSRVALSRQAQEGVNGLFEFNQSIFSRLKDVIKEVGGEPATMPIYNSGDGALIFCKANPSPDLAVRFAQRLQNLTKEKNLESSNYGSEPWQFRIGIASGEVRMKLQLDAAGSLWGFSSAGIPIINAVRIQTNCKAEEVWIDSETYNGLSADIKSDFKPAPAVIPKGHENRIIEVYKWPSKSND